MHAAALARAEYTAEVVRIFYPVEDNYERRAVLPFRRFEDIVYRRVFEVDGVADTALVLCAFRRAVERLFVAELYVYAALPRKVEYIGYSVIVRAARQ